jgi:hypothetical protein
VNAGLIQSLKGERRLDEAIALLGGLGVQVTNASDRRFNVSIGTPGIAAPAVVDLNRMERGVLITLYNIENSMVKAIKGLFALLHSGSRMDPDAFGVKLGEFGRALLPFDDFDQTTNTRGSSQLQFGPLALTRALCPTGSLHDQIVKQWGNIRSFVIRDGHLFLALMADGGIYEFEPAVPR